MKKEWTPIEDLALDKMHTFEDGTPILVARPTNPELAIAIMKDIVGGDKQSWEAAQERLNEECGPYTFVGFWGRPPKLRGMTKHRARQKPPDDYLVNERGEKIGEVEPGDSFVHTTFFDGATAPDAETN